MITDPEAAKMMARARIRLLLQEPFFGELAIRLQPIEDCTLNPPTLATDGRSLFYHPVWVRANPHNVRMSGWAHEIGHCIFDSFGRRQSREPKRWNSASDYKINELLKDSGFTIGEGWLFNPEYRGMAAERVYDLLPPGGQGHSSFDPIKAPPANDKQTQEQVATDWKIATVQAANAARKAGRLPGAMQEFIDGFLNGQADWKTLLRRFINQPAREDYSWMRPNKCFASMGIYLPGLYSERMDTLVVVTDDSGSVANKFLQAFAGETSEARDAGNPRRTIVISCDARVNHVDTLEPGDPFEIKRYGGCGTDFRPPFKWLKKEGIVPSALVYLTDLEGPAPEVPPDYPVLWCTINNHIAPWGETIKIEV